jgi:hypothetical protein
MTDRQNAKLNMYEKVLIVFNEYKDVYAKVPALGIAVNKLQEHVTDIKSVTKQQTENRPQDVTKDKSSAIDRLVDITLKISSPIYVYASDTVNNRLLGRVNLNKSMFYSVHDQQALTISKIVASEAKSCGEVLLDYGVTKDDLTALDAAIAQVEGLINAPLITIGTRKLYTSNLRELFVAADSIVYDKLDKLMRLFKTSNPEFFTLYSNARNVINTAARKRKNDGEDMATEETTNE